MKTAAQWIEKLGLKQHPEGGYYKEEYRSDEEIGKTQLPPRYNGARNFATSIYFLLKSNEFSSFHRIKSDETWHFYQGTQLELLVLKHDGTLVSYLLGDDFESGERLQITIPRNHWFAARVKQKLSFALLGCTVAPGFHFEDFELASRNQLTEQFPQHRNIIEKLTFA